MASNYTAKYKLNQWEAQDKVLRTEFNTDNARIEAALTGLDSSKASAAALDALKAVVDSKAGQTDLDQLAAAQEAGLTLRNCYVYTTRFTTDGESTHTFRFPHKPWLVLLCSAAQYIYVAVRGVSQGSWIGSANNPFIKYTWDGTSLTVEELGGGTMLGVPKNTLTILALLEP